MVSDIGVGIILSASCLPLTFFYFMLKLKFLLFHFMVQNLREMSVYTSYSNIVCQIQKHFY